MPDARTLMRSRYSAYALGEAEYLWNTLHPDHPSRQEDHDAFVAQLRASRQTLRFARLRILDDDVSPDGQTARVLFHAELYEKGKERSFLELSTFRRTALGWRYLSGETRDLRADSKELDTLAEKRGQATFLKAEK